MSKTIDQRVVEMRFDNANFEKNVSTSMSTLDKLKKSLKFEDSAKGFENISKAAGRVDMGGLSSGVESVRLKFSALEVMAVTALTNITNSALNAGKKIAAALTIEPIKTGLQEYETQINATQTILANTQKEGATIHDVNRALDELNKYADLTIYNFTEMTRNIGTFTAAGVNLDTSVNAIKGIANLAAMSGSASQQASTAMYQLSQALASGTVKLMDWNSVVNAGMGGQTFQDALKMTARIHGIAIDEMIADEGSFRETLSKGWLTADIMTETLQHFTEFTDTYNEESLKRQGYNDEEIAQIKQMGITATDAATKVKTVSQLWDVMKETAQSGWTATWKILIGDFEEAKETLTAFSEALNKPIEEAANARNAVLSGGLSSGWKQFLNEGIEDTEGFKETLISVAKESIPGLDDMIDKAGGFEESLKSGWVTSDMLATSISNLAAKTAGLSDEELRNLGYTRDQVTALENLNKAIQDGSIDLDDYAKKMGRISGRENIIQALTLAFEKLQTVLSVVKEAFSEVFPPITGEQLYNFTVQIKDFVSGLTMSEEALEKFKMTFKGAFAFVDIVGQSLKAFGQIFGHILEKILPTGDGILGVTGSIGEWIVSIDEAIKSGDGLAKFIENVNGVIDTLADKIRIAKDYIVDLIKSWTGIDSLRDLLSRVFSGISNLISGATEHIGSFSDVLSTVGDVVSKVAGGIWKSLKAVFSWISDNISIGDIFAGLAGGGIFAVAKKLSGLIEKIKDALDRLFGDGENKVGGKFADVMNSIHDTLSSFQDGIKISSIVAVAVAVGILSASIKAISDLDVGQITKSLFAVGTMLAMLSATMKSLSKTLSGLGSKGLLKAGASLVLVAASVSILAGAIKKLADLSLGDIAKGLIALGGGLLELSIGLKIIDKTKIKLSMSIGMLALAASCTILADALKKFGEMSWEEIARGLVGMGGALTELVAAVSILDKFGGGKSLFGGLAILIVVQSLSKMADGLKSFSEMSWDEIGRGLTAMGGALAELGLVLGLLGKFAGFSSIFASGAILMVAQGLDDIANALEQFAGMTWDEIGRGLAGMGGALGEIALITGLLGGLVGFSAIFAAGAILIVIKGLADLAEAFKSFAGMTWDEIGRGLAGMGGALTEVGVITGLLGALTGLSGLLGAGALLLAIQGLADLASAFKSFGEMSWEEIAHGLVGMGGALLEVSAITGALGAIAGLPALLGSGAILLAVQGLGDLANALQTFGEMSWDEIGRGLSAMGGALGELALGSVLNTLSGLGALSISTVAEPLGALADSVKKWTDVTIPDGLGIKLAVLAGAISAFTFSGIGATALSTAAEPVGVLAESVKKWTGVTVPDGLSEKMSALATGIEKFTFAGLGASALSDSAPGVGEMADSVKKWSTVSVPDDLEEGLKRIASGVKSFSFAFLGGWSIGAITEPLSNLADSIKKWRSVSIPNDLGDSLDSLARGIKSFSFAFLGGWSLDAIIEPLSNLGDCVKKWRYISIPNDIGNSLDLLADGIKSFSWAFLGGWSLGAITGPLGDLAGSVAKWRNVSIPSSLGDDLTKLAGGVSAFADIPDVSITANSLKAISAAVKELAGVNFSSISVGFSGIITSIKALSSIDAVSATLSKFGAELVNRIIKPVQSSTVQFKKAGNSLADSLMNGFNARQPALVSKMKSTMQALTNTVASKKSDFRKVGSELVTQLSGGIGSQTNAINSKFASILSSAVQAVRSYYSQFQSAGSYLVAGIANGISANASTVSAASSNIAARAVSSAKSRLQINSPSKVGYQIGDYFGIGFANGITDNIRNAEVTSEQLADSATAGLTSAASKIAAVINSDMDTTPTIRPVLDLTEIQNGAVAMANLMNSLSGRPVEGTVSIAARTANSMSHPTASSTPATNASDVKNTENNVNNFYITGTDPRAIAEEVDRKLQRKVERKRAAWA